MKLPTNSTRDSAIHPGDFTAKTAKIAKTGHISAIRKENGILGNSQFEFRNSKWVGHLACFAVELQRLGSVGQLGGDRNVQGYPEETSDWKVRVKGESIADALLAHEGEACCIHYPRTPAPRSSGASPLGGGKVGVMAARDVLPPDAPSLPDHWSFREAVWQFGLPHPQDNSPHCLPTLKWQLPSVAAKWGAHNRKPGEWCLLVRYQRGEVEGYGRSKEARRHASSCFICSGRSCPIRLVMRFFEIVARVSHLIAESVKSPAALAASVPR